MKSSSDHLTFEGEQGPNDPHFEPSSPDVSTLTSCNLAAMSSQAEECYMIAKDVRDEGKVLVAPRGLLVLPDQYNRSVGGPSTTFLKADMRHHTNVSPEFKVVLQSGECHEQFHEVQSLLGETHKFVG